MDKTNLPKQRLTGKPPYVSLPDAARKLRLSWSTVVGLIRRGELVGQLVDGTRWFVRRESLDAWLRRDDGRGA